MVIDIDLFSFQKEYFKYHILHTYEAAELSRYVSSGEKEKVLISTVAIFLV